MMNAAMMNDATMNDEQLLFNAVFITSVAFITPRLSLIAPQPQLSL